MLRAGYSWLNHSVAESHNSHSHNTTPNCQLLRNQQQFLLIFYLSHLVSLSLRKSGFLKYQPISRLPREVWRHGKESSGYWLRTVIWRRPSQEAGNPFSLKTWSRHISYTWRLRFHGFTPLLLLNLSFLDQWLGASGFRSCAACISKPRTTSPGTSGIKPLRFWLRNSISGMITISAIPSPSYSILLRCPGRKTFWSILCEQRTGSSLYPFLRGKKLCG